MYEAYEVSLDAREHIKGNVQYCSNARRERLAKMGPNTSDGLEPLKDSK